MSQVPSSGPYGPQSSIFPSNESPMVSFAISILGTTVFLWHPVNSEHKHSSSGILPATKITMPTFPIPLVGRKYLLKRQIDAFFIHYRAYRPDREDQPQCRKENENDESVGRQEVLGDQDQ